MNNSEEKIFVSSLGEQVRVADFEKEVESIILSHCIMIDDVLSFVALKIRQGQILKAYFRNNWERVILQWVLDYYSQWRKAPGPVNIQNIFDLERNRLETADIQIIEAILDGLAEKFNDHVRKNLSSELIKKEFIPFFVKRAYAERLAQSIELCVNTNRVDDIYRTIDQAKRYTDDDDENYGVSIPGTNEAVNEYYNSTSGEPLFQLDGDIGRFIGPFYRGATYAITAIEKRGKSYFSQDVLFRAVMQHRLKGLNVSLELGQKMINSRVWCRAGNYTSDKYSVGRQLIPVFDCLNNQLGTCGVRKTKINFRNLLRNEASVAAYYENRDWKICTRCRLNMKGRYQDYSVSKEKRFIPSLWFKEQQIKGLTRFRIEKTNRLINFFGFKNLRHKTYNRGKASFDEIREFILNYIEKTGFKPDIIVIDYPDILQPSQGKLLDRENINYNWLNCGGLAQELDVALILPDQTKKDARDARSITESDTSENKLKDAHIDLRITLNATREERELGIQRVGTLFKREGEEITSEVMLTQNKYTGNRILDSVFWNHNWLKYPIIKAK